LHEPHATSLVAQLVRESGRSAPARRDMRQGGQFIFNRILTPFSMLSHYVSVQDERMKTSRRCGAVWSVARGYIASGATQGIERLKRSITTAASRHYGATGWTALDDSGDRRYGDFDFWAIELQKWCAMLDTDRRIRIANGAAVPSNALRPV